MMHQKHNDRFDVWKLSDTPIKPRVGSSNPMQEIPNTIASPLLDTLKSRRSGRIVRASDRFMFLWEVVSKKYDLDPINYNKDISSKDSGNWKSVMKVEEDIYMM